MNIIERAREFVQGLVRLASRDAWDWHRCPHCGSSDTCRYGFYSRSPWSLAGRQSLRVQRHRCHGCGRTYGEESAQVRVRRRYGRDVQRLSLDHWCHDGTSLRRAASFVRSIIGRQERYLIWQPWAVRMPGPECTLAPATVGRWLDEAGVRAQASVKGQLAGADVADVAADGLWARLRQGGKRVVLMLVDSSSGLVYPPLVAKGEGSEEPWARLFARAAQAGLELDRLRGVTSDWASGLVSYLRQQLPWPQHQRCLWHFWRGRIRPYLASLGEGAREPVATLVLSLMRAPSYEQAEALLCQLAAHADGRQLAAQINEQFDHLFVHLLEYYRGLAPVSPEWCWRDYRLRLGHGRNHGSGERFERAALVWAIYHNFTPAQRRSERKRTYRHPGMSPLEVAGLSPGNLSYLDALAV
jgi:Transposase, Mutator family